MTAHDPLSKMEISTYTNRAVVEMSIQCGDDPETSKFPRSSRFFNRNRELPDLRTFQPHIDDVPLSFNGQTTNITYNPFSYPQLRTKHNYSLDTYHLPSKILLTESLRDKTLADEVYSSDRERYIRAHETLIPGQGIPLLQLDNTQAKDPITVIENNTELGRRYGAVKLRLPEQEDSLIRSNFQINSDLFWFETNKLLNSPIRDEVVSRLLFHIALVKFHMHVNSREPVENDKGTASKEDGVTIAKRDPSIEPEIQSPHPMSITSITSLVDTPSPPQQDNDKGRKDDIKKTKLPSFITKAPLIDKRTLDLYKLFRSVLIRGGFMEVVNKKLWAQIGRELGYKGKIMTSLSSSLKSAYLKFLHEFEIYLGDKLFQLMGLDPFTKTELMSAGAVKSEEEKTSIKKEENGEGLKRAGDEHLTEDNNKRRKFDSPSPVVIGSATEFKRSSKCKLSKGILLNVPHLIETKQSNIFATIPPENLKAPSSDVTSYKKKGKKIFDISESSLSPQSQFNQAIESLLTNLEHQDEAPNTSSSRNVSVYSIRQFMEKDFKFQEFIVKQNRAVFNRQYSDIPPQSQVSNQVPSLAAFQGNHLPETKISPENQTPPSTSQNTHTPNNTSIISNQQHIERNGTPLPGNSCGPQYHREALVPERNFAKLSDFECLYWKFVENDQYLNVLGDGIELENGENIPSCISGSGFVRIGDDLLNYKNSLYNLNINARSSGNKYTTPPENNSTPQITPGLSKFISGASASNLNASQQDVSHFNSKDYILNTFEASLLPWNLHNIPILPNSLFGAFQEHDLNNHDLVNTRVNIGMTFSTLNWKCEDHFSQLINYQFFGACKKWYFIPELEFDKFEKLLEELTTSGTEMATFNNKCPEKRMRKILDLFEVGNEKEIDMEALIYALDNLIYPSGDIRLPFANPTFRKLLSKPDPLKYNQDFLITPDMLKKRGIKYSTAIQKPGEIIVKYPKTYSFNFSMGLNFSEETNFATKTWLDNALEGEKWLTKQSILPNFLTFKLVVNMIQLYDSGKQIGFSADVFEKLRHMYETFYEEETDLRTKARRLKIPESLIDEKNLFEADLIADDDLANAFPSKVVVTEKSSKDTIILSLKSFLEYNESNVIDLDSFTAELQVVYSDDKLKQFSRILKNYSIDHESWTNNYESLMSEDAELPLKTYKTLLSDGERIYSAVTSSELMTSSDGIETTKLAKLQVFVNHVTNLRKFLDNCNQIIEECQSILAIKHQQRIRNGAYYLNTEKLLKLVKLVGKISRLPVSCPEFDQIIEFKTEIENFDKAARSLLSKKSRPIEEFNDLINLGQSFGISIPSLSFLIRVRDRLEWLQTFKLIDKGVDPYGDKKKVFSINDLEEFLSTGAKILASEDHALIKMVSQILADSRVFDAEISKFLLIDDYLKLDLKEFNCIADKFRLEKLFISPDIYDELSKIHACLPLIKQYNNLYRDSTTKPSYHVIKQLHTNLVEAKLKVDIQNLEKDLLQTEAWVNSVWELVSKVRIATTIKDNSNINTPKASINPNLCEKLKTMIPKSAYSFSDDDLYDITSSCLLKFGSNIELLFNEKEPRSEGAEEDKTPKFYCICREYEHGTMIECDKCNEWYHVQCVDAEDSEKESENESYSCPVCILIESGSDKNDWIRGSLTLGAIACLLESGENLPIIAATEIATLREIKEQMEVYKLKVDAVVERIEQSNFTVEMKVDMLKWVLRKVYGSAVLLDDRFQRVLSMIRAYEALISQAQHAIFVQKQVQLPVAETEVKTNEPTLIDPSLNGTQEPTKSLSGEIMIENGGISLTTTSCEKEPATSQVEPIIENASTNGFDQFANTVKDESIQVKKAEDHKLPESSLHTNIPLDPQLDQIDPDLV